MADENVEHQDAANADAATAGKWSAARATVRRALHWAAAHRTVAGVIAGSTIVLLIGIPVVLLLSAGGAQGEPETGSFAAALAALDQGDYAAARQIAESLRDSGDLPYEELGGPSFVFGVIAAREAEEKWGDERIRYYTLAASHLEQARDRGFPAGRAPEGHYIMGHSLFQSGRIPQSRAALRDALPVNPDRQSEIHRLLALAYLQDANPKYEEALEHNTLYLADRTLEPDERLEGLVQRGRILLGMGDVPQCRETLESLGPAARTNSESLILSGILLMVEARSLQEEGTAPGARPSAAAVEKYRKAIQLFREAQGHDRLQSQSTRKAYYLIGVAAMEMGNHPGALAQWARTRRVFPDSPEGFAASLEEADLLRRGGQGAEALAAYRRTLMSLADPENFSNPWFSLDTLRERLLAAYRDFLDRGVYEPAVALAAEMEPVVPRSESLLLKAEAFKTWGQAKLAAADGMDPNEAEAQRRTGREQFRRAGMVYAELALLRIATRDYPDDVWQSAESFLAGHDYVSATRQYRKYLEIEGRRRRPLALVGLADALLARGEVDAALEAVHECLRAYPRDVAIFSARLLAAKAHVEKGEPEKAVELLTENLEGELLDPDSREWRESLLDVGKILHFSGRHKEAVPRLSVAVARWPTGPRAVSTRYLLAESYRQHAQVLARSLETEVVPPERIAAAREKERMNDAAAEEYGNVIARLSERQSRQELTELERLMLRNSYFARGAMLHQLDRYSEAIQAYSDAANRYQNRPEVLEAYLQIADSYRRIDEPEKARIALRQAQSVLKRLPGDTPFTETTNYTAAQWGEMLQWMGDL